MAVEMALIRSAVAGVTAGAVITAVPAAIVYMAQPSAGLDKVLYALLPGAATAALLHVSPHEAAFLHWAVGGSFVWYSLAAYLVIRVRERVVRNRHGSESA